MEITVNGNVMNFPGENISLPELMQLLNLSAEQKGIAIGVNREIIPRSQWESAWIHAGDKVEIITALQGG